MALSDITLKQLRSDLRSRLGKMTTEEFTDAELNNWINIGQFETFVRLNGISDHWYGTTQTISITASAGTITAINLTNSYGADKISRIIKLVGPSGNLIPFCDTTEINGYLGNSNYDNSYACNWFGEKLYIFVGASATPLSSANCTLFFIRKPDELTSDSSTLDIPTEFVDLAIMSAMSKALLKLNMLNEKATVDNDVASKFNDIRQMFSSEIQLMTAEKAPGVQTPRVK